MKKAIAAALWCILLTALLPAAAFAQTLLVGGQVVGIQVSTKGVLVAALSPVETAEGSCSPAESAGLKEGDLIEEVDGETVENAARLIDIMAAQDGKPIQLTVRRGEELLQIPVQPVQAAEGQWRMGIWLRDSISGIGTLTFCDPVSGIFGALGHSISNGEEGAEVKLSGGSISRAEVVGVTQGAAGTPGELNGVSDLGAVLGRIDGNTDHGIYGQAYTALGSQLLEIGEIHTGPAQILSTVNGKEPSAYHIEINRVFRDAEGAHVMLTVTDPALMVRTGGIVQGMSGSPIIQDGKLTGAVTHVFVDNPSRGYGVSIQDMLHAAGLALTEQAA